ncbi:MAG: metalloregulator ArsR/SmtB family transcription factor [Gammaproteobacteria bacterium]|nr:metalloregulator ArsR/SmtB family transcription factor [Gammaproteobacteria bacterium]MDH5653759.1 metalloregulator ArsR/SmtB family transcription factor [Gammaproteobacteria bacterium]
MSTGPGFKQQLFAQFARVGKALSNGNRLELLEFLAQGERCVDDLAEAAGLSVANTSQHLQQLRQSGLVVSRKAGLKVYYRLSGEDVPAVLTAIREVAERHLDEVTDLITGYLHQKDRLEPLAREELLARVQDQLVTVIDVRPAVEYQAGHLPGAINIPLSELKQRIAELDPAQEIVAYCRGPHCVLAFDAVAFLREAGRKARRLQDGYPEWKAAGLPIASDK